MRRLVLSFTLIVATLFLFMPMQPVKATYSVRYYTVYWDCDCHIGPTACNVIEGEWTRECDGVWYGWGWKPDEYKCTFYTMTIGEPCE